MKHDYDFLVIGSGIAGLFYALKVATMVPSASVAVITKKGERDTNTNRAQGGIAAVLSGTDSFEAHVRDTLEAGAGLCRKSVVEKVVAAGPSAVKELVKYGAQFTTRETSFDLGREGGHSASRVVHAADFTGQEIERALIDACRQLAGRITIFRDHIGLELLVGERDGIAVCAGATILSTAGMEVQTVRAPVTLLATGGIGQVYLHTTNPRIATGDGIALAYRAGVSVANLEFIQFHPTVLYNPGRWPFLISEAIRGEGARLHSVDGRYFMENAHPMGELAPRDIVARAIDRELKTSGEEYVMLDISHREEEFIRTRFPGIYKTCLERGFDITQRPVPVVPAAHYSCGGVVSSIEGQTSLPGLYVAGEVAMTGMHGANRLASNSLLESVVMAGLAATQSVGYHRESDGWVPPPLEPTFRSGTRNEPEKLVIAHMRNELTRVMSDFVGIVRSNQRLELATARLEAIVRESEAIYDRSRPTYGSAELRNMAQAASLIVSCAHERKESRGLHFTEDYPEPIPSLAVDTLLTSPYIQTHQPDVVPTDDSHS